MNIGQTVFAQIFQFILHNEFRRCVERYGGNRRARQLSCWEQFLAMAFAQLSYRESLRATSRCASEHYVSLVSGEQEHPPLPLKERWRGGASRDRCGRRMTTGKRSRMPARPELFNRLPRRSIVSGAARDFASAARFPQLDPHLNPINLACLPPAPHTK